MKDPGLGSKGTVYDVTVSATTAKDVARCHTVLAAIIIAKIGFNVAQVLRGSAHLSRNKVNLIQRRNPMGLGLVF